MLSKPGSFKFCPFSPCSPLNLSCRATVRHAIRTPFCGALDEPNPIQRTTSALTPGTGWLHPGGGPRRGLAPAATLCLVSANLVGGTCSTGSRCPQDEDATNERASRISGGRARRSGCCGDGQCSCRRVARTCVLRRCWSRRRTVHKSRLGDTQRPTETHRDRQRRTETDRDAQRSAETHRDRQRRTETGRDAQRSAETHRNRQRRSEKRDNRPAVRSSQRSRIFSCR